MPAAARIFGAFWDACSQFFPRRRDHSGAAQGQSALALELLVAGPGFGPDAQPHLLVAGDPAAPFGPRRGREVPNPPRIRRYLALSSFAPILRMCRRFPVRAAR